MFRCLRRRNKTTPPHVQRETGGQQARERAEATLADVRQRREEVRSIRAFFDYQLTRNHFAQDINALFRGEHS